MTDLSRVIIPLLSDVFMIFMWTIHMNIPGKLSTLQLPSNVTRKWTQQVMPEMHPQDDFEECADWDELEDDMVNVGHFSVCEVTGDPKRCTSDKINVSILTKV